MPISVKISLCKITRCSKLFQRNYYLPLLKPLSPKDALRRRLITGQNILGARIEHYIPVLLTTEDKLSDKKKRPKGQPIIKKKMKIKEGTKYVEPFFDDDMEHHLMLQSVLNRKGKAKAQKYAYDIPDKKCSILLGSLMEKAIKDKEIVDVVVAQRSEKIVVKLTNGVKISLPLAKYDGTGAVYRGSGWTKALAEEDHHHGKDTMSMARLFEAKESGVEDWELEMMRMAGKRKKKCKGEDSADWKAMVVSCVDGMDWDQFDEDTKQIIDESEELVDEEDIPMAVDNMELTKNVNAKLLDGGEFILLQLPTMKEIPEVIKTLESGDLCEVCSVSGVNIKMSSGKMCFITGQMVKTDENQVFVPGQTVESESGTCEYIPGITVYMDGEPSLIPGLVFGEQETTPIFLPGDSTITQDGQLQFEATEEDRPIRVEEVEVIVIPVREATPTEDNMSPPLCNAFRPQRQPCLEDELEEYENRRRQREELERKRLRERHDEKLLKEEGKVDKIRYEIRKKVRDFVVEKPKPFKAAEPVKKSEKLEEMEKHISTGTFFDDEHTKLVLEKVRTTTKQQKYTSARHSIEYGTEPEFSFVGRRPRVI